MLRLSDLLCCSARNSMSYLRGGRGGENRRSVFYTSGGGGGGGAAEEWELLDAPAKDFPEHKNPSDTHRSRSTQCVLMFSVCVGQLVLTWWRRR